LREALKQRPDKKCAIMMESKGPSIHSGNLKEGKPVTLVEGQELLIVIDMNMEGDNTKIACSYKNLPDTVIIGSVVCISIEND
jgi:pyruvate kinase